MKESEIKTILATPISKAGKTSSSYNKRIANIAWIEDIDRAGLIFQKKERQLLIHTTSTGERVFIQYPGKESMTHKKNGKKREQSAIRPWDFRPRVYLLNTLEHYKDQSFADIWASIFEIAENLIKNKKQGLLRIFATLLYRMAFMYDHTENKIFKTVIRDVTYEKNGKAIFSQQKEKEFPGFFKYSPNSEILKYLVKECPLWGGISLEGFLFYNEILTWNEDCKYCYRNTYIKCGLHPKWIGSTGRVNTLLTHIRILGSILGDIHLANIFNDFANQRGVSPASDDEILTICKDYVHKA